MNLEQTQAIQLPGCNRAHFSRERVFAKNLGKTSSGNMVWKGVSTLFYEIIFFLCIFPLLIEGIYPSPSTRPHPTSTSTICFTVSSRVWYSLLDLFSLTKRIPAKGFTCTKTYLKNCIESFDRFFFGKHFFRKNILLVRGREIFFRENLVKVIGRTEL